MRIDAHQHFWAYDPGRYGWISDEMSVLKRDFLPEDLAPRLAEEGLDASVAVQARQDLDETRWLLDLAEANSFVAGVVGWVDLCSDEVDAELDELASRPALRGVRHVVQDEPDDDFMLRPDFCAGVAKLAERDLTYDILIYARHLPVAARFVDRFPEQPFVLDHIAKPFIAKGEREPWARDVRELARREHVCCKVSGMVTEARWSGWRPADFRPYLDVVFEAFGVERLMYGSDWPVCRLASEYGPMKAILDDYAAALSEDERAALYGGNAARFYGLRP